MFVFCLYIYICLEREGESVMKSKYPIASYVYFTAFVVLCCFCVFVELNDLFCI